MVEIVKELSRLVPVVTVGSFFVYWQVVRKRLRCMEDCHFNRMTGFLGLLLGTELSLTLELRGWDMLICYVSTSMVAQLGFFDHRTIKEVEMDLVSLVKK